MKLYQWDCRPLRRPCFPALDITMAIIRIRIEIKEKAILAYNLSRRLKIYYLYYIL